MYSFEALRRVLGDLLLRRRWPLSRDPRPAARDSPGFFHDTPEALMGRRQGALLCPASQRWVEPWRCPARSC